jgi:hypothetical protein
MTMGDRHRDQKSEVDFGLEAYCSLQCARYHPRNPATRPLWRAKSRGGGPLLLFGSVSAPVRHWLFRPSCRGFVLERKKKKGKRQERKKKRKEKEKKTERIQVLKNSLKIQTKPKIAISALPE